MRIRFSVKKRVDSDRRRRISGGQLTLVTKLRRARRPVCVEMTPIGRNTGQSAHESRQFRFGRKTRAAASPYGLTSGPESQLWFPIRQRPPAPAVPARDRAFKPGTKAARIGDRAIRGPRAPLGSEAGLTSSVAARRPVAAAASGPTFGELNRRARNVAIGTEDAAVSWLGLQHRSASLAIVKELTGVGRHRLRRAVAATRTRDRGFQDRRRLNHARIPSKKAPQRAINPSPPP